MQVLRRSTHQCLLLLLLLWSWAGIRSTCVCSRLTSKCFLLFLPRQFAAVKLRSGWPELHGAAAPLARCSLTWRDRCELAAAHTSASRFVNSRSIVALWFRRIALREEGMNWCFDSFDGSVSTDWVGLSTRVSCELVRVSWLEYSCELWTCASELAWFRALSRMKVYLTATCCKLPPSRDFLSHFFQTLINLRARVRTSLHRHPRHSTSIKAWRNLFTTKRCHRSRDVIAVISWVLMRATYFTFAIVANSSLLPLA